MNRTDGKFDGGWLAGKLKAEYRNRGLGAVSHSSARTARKPKPWWRRLISEELRLKASELQMEKKRLPRYFLPVLGLFTVVLMVIIMFGAQVYQASQEISSLEKEMVSLKETISDLELKLDEKNDIRLIEQMATVGLGMVKEDSLRKKYISLSEGESVDIIEAASTSEKEMGTMLSSIFEVFGDLLEYFK